MLICPDAIGAQNSMAAVSAEWQPAHNILVHGAAKQRGERAPERRVLTDLGLPATGAVELDAGEVRWDDSGGDLVHWLAPVHPHSAAYVEASNPDIHEALDDLGKDRDSSDGINTAR